MKWFSYPRFDGEITGELVCVVCASRLDPKTKRELVEITTEIPDVDMKHCHLCLRPAGDPRRAFIKEPPPDKPKHVQPNPKWLKKSRGEVCL